MNVTFFYPSHPHIYRDERELEWALAQNRDALRRHDERLRAAHVDAPSPPAPEERGRALADEHREAQCGPCDGEDG